MSEVAVENPSNGVDSTPSRRDRGKHWVEKSIEDIADDYFSSVNPFAKKIVLDKKKCQQQCSDWDGLSQSEKDTVLNDWFIDASIKLRYELKLGIIDPKPVASDIFPRLIVQGGAKTVQYRDDQDGSNTGKILTWKDEFSGPFSWETKCQQDLAVVNGESSTTGTPRHEPTTAESLLQPKDSHSRKNSEDAALFPSPKGEDQQHANSFMVMKDVTKRHSFGSNLLASLEERLAFDEAVGDAIEGKTEEKDYQHIGHVGTKYVHAGETADSSSGSSTPRESRSKSSEHNYKSPNREKFKPSKPKMAPPGPGPKPRDIPKYTDPPRYHKSQPQSPKYNESPKYKIEQMEPPSQSINRGRPTVESPKQPKTSRPKVEPPKPKMEPPKQNIELSRPKTETPRHKTEPSKPKTEPPRPKMEPSKPKMEPPRPKTEPPKLRAESARPKMYPPKQPGNRPRPGMDPPQEPTRQKSEKTSGGLPSPKRQAAAKEVDKVQLLPSSAPSGTSREGIPPSTSHDNITVEVKEEKGSKAPEPVSGDQLSGAGAAGTGGFDFLMEW